MKEFVRQGLYGLILLAALGAAGWVLVTRTSAGGLAPDHHVPMVRVGQLRHAHRHTSAAADDGVSHAHQRLRPVDVLFLSPSSSILTFATPANAEKDLLSLTQRRRE
jgi:hypothetical protein